jgi:hypothetical protein
MNQMTLSRPRAKSSSLLNKAVILFLTAGLFFAGTGFRSQFSTMVYGGGSGPQIVATYDGYAVTVANGTPGPVRIDYNAGGWLYRDIITPGTPYSIPSNTTSVTFSNAASTSYYGIYP